MMRVRGGGCSYNSSPSFCRSIVGDDANGELIHLLASCRVSFRVQFSRREVHDSRVARQMANARVRHLQLSWTPQAPRFHLTQADLHDFGLPISKSPATSFSHLRPLTPPRPLFRCVDVWTGFIGRPRIRNHRCTKHHLIVTQATATAAMQAFFDWCTLPSVPTMHAPKLTTIVSASAHSLGPPVLARPRQQARQAALPRPRQCRQDHCTQMRLKPTIPIHPH